MSLILTYQEKHSSRKLFITYQEKDIKDTHTIFSTYQEKEKQGNINTRKKK